MTKLDPAVASKYGEYIQWRICALNTAGPEDRTLSWEELKKLKAGENRDYSTWTEFLKGYQRNGEEYACWTIAWEKATESITDTLVCLDAATGKLLWKKDFPATKVSVGWGLSPSGTPAVWNGKCYFVGIMGIYCLSAKDGTLLWQSKEGGNSHASVLVANGVVVGGWPLAAYDAESGKKLWYTGNYRAGGTPILWSTGGKNYIIAAGSWGVTLCCIDMATWKVVWDFKTGNSGQSTPVIVGDTLVFSADVGTCAYKITPEKAEFLWKSPVNDGIESFVVYQDHIYMDISNHRAPEWYCLSLKTGETKWHLRNPSSRGNIVSSPILADGKIMIPTTSEGTHAGYTLQMFKPSPEKFISLGKFNPEGAQCSSPAFVGGKLYLRVWDGIACYDLTAK
ncbi:MAG: PQQ-like beta-propeller repeat protein [Planctomycetes bacterium]|nr:PQQ-like beta-propeller repeat protein [Planctomycetota bacterium]